MQASNSCAALATISAAGRSLSFVGERNFVSPEELTGGTKKDSAVEGRTQEKTTTYGLARLLKCHAVEERFFNRETGVHEQHLWRNL
jgi:hypothetical protein